MHARVVTLKVHPETAAEAVRRYDESIENSKRTPGYKMGILLTNPDTGKGFSITLWETKEQVLEGNTGGYYAQQMRTMGDVWAEPPILEDYDVSIFYNHDT
jgi:heme-degrading monooxygenase HmoA